MRIERFHSTWTGSSASAVRWFAAFVYYYNWHRPNQALDNRTPVLPRSVHEDMTDPIWAAFQADLHAATLGNRVARSYHQRPKELAIDEPTKGFEEALARGVNDHVFGM